jgi:hypothetical protein
MTFATFESPRPMAQPALPRYAHRRGTRGFAAFLTVLSGFVVLAVGAVVLPSTELDRIPMAWLVPGTIAFGIAHFVAAIGLIRRRAWGATLVGYIGAIGIGVAGYGLLVTLTGLDPFGATSSLPGEQARAEGLGLLLWMAALWALAARSAFRAFSRS